MECEVYGTAEAVPFVHHGNPRTRCHLDGCRSIVCRSLNQPEPRALMAHSFPYLKPAGNDARTHAAEAPRVSPPFQLSYSKTHKSHPSSYQD
jgi:hypothetical protein